MNQINLLRETLKPHLEWHGARLNFLSLFLLALIRVKTVNLSELACGFRSSARTESNYKRLQRFFGKLDLDYAAVARLIVALMNIPQPWVLSLDRTEWSFGQTRCEHLPVGSRSSGSSLSFSLDYAGQEGKFQQSRTDGFTRQVSRGLSRCGDRLPLRSPENSSARNG